MLDLTTFEYRPAVKPALPALEMAKNAATLPERLRLLLANDPAKDKAAAFLWPFLASLWNYAADRIGEVAGDAASIDQAMRAGFNWELGPFEMWDAAGVASSCARMKALGVAGERARAEALLAPERRRRGTRTTGRSASSRPRDGWSRLRSARPRAGRGFPPRPMGWCGAIAGASLVDLGDGIGCIELHSLKNAIGGDVLAMISSVLNPASDAVRDFAGFVITGDRENFSVGANLMQLLLVAQEGEWDEVDAVIHGFQQMTAAIKFCPRPVVVAPFGLTLGGGAEICLHAARRQPHAETYIGLVEAGSGADSGRRRDEGDAAARGGCGRRAGAARSRAIRRRGLRNRRRWMTALEARARDDCAWPRFPLRPRRRGALGLLAPADRITMNRERLLLDAKAQAAALAEAGYTAPQPRTQIPAPGTAALGDAGDRHLSDGRGGICLGARPEGGALGCVHPGRRAGDGGIAGERAVPAGSGARGVSFAVRRAQDAGADRVYAEDRQAAAELTYVRM